LADVDRGKPSEMASLTTAAAANLSGIGMPMIIANTAIASDGVV
jgi:hypothetical protein